jgi:alkanesulfonate monooxygenase SsuD/methylene tetrahydromethanopterin reductase-like flavin-dependent oxidoreductase (luciferase family)
MDFGTLIFTKPERAITDPAYAEKRGFTHAWIPDSQMIWGDTYACMALAAVNTSTIKLGTGVAIASNRIAPVTAHSIATINQLAPGRTILGFGTGHTARRVMGFPPVKHANFRNQVRELRELLNTGETIHQAEGIERKVRFLHRDLRFINLDDPPVPFYVAANGPRTLALAGEFGDGVITTGVMTPDRVESVKRHVDEGARRANRGDAKLPLVSLTHVCVLRPGEKLDSARVAAMTGHWVMAGMHAVAAGYARGESLPSEARKVFDAYVEHVNRLPAPPAERYLDLHVGHCTYVTPAERKFVTPETIRALTIAGPREEVLERLRALSRAGLAQVFVNPPMDGFNDYIDEFSREVIERM